MARTVLRSRSGDIATTIQLADRTGIVAASAPPAVEEPKVPELAPANTLSVLVAASAPRPAAARNIVFTCAAALFLVIGWIGGEVWGQHDAGPAPALAVGAAADQGQGGTKPADPVVTDAPPPIVPAPRAAPVEGKRQAAAPAARTADATGKESSASAASERADSGHDQTTTTQQEPVEPMAERLQHLLSAWQAVPEYRVHVYRNYGH